MVDGRQRCPEKQMRRIETKVTSASARSRGRLHRVGWSSEAGTPGPGDRATTSPAPEPPGNVNLFNIVLFLDFLPSVAAALLQSFALDFLWIF